LNRFEEYLPVLRQALQSLDAWRSSYGDIDDNTAHYQAESLMPILAELSEKLRGNYPFHHPSYAAQMLKPPHPAAWLAYALTSTINPNNHALDGGPPSSEMEKECVRHLAQMVGYDSSFLGHLTSAGTIANLEALFVAREIHPDKAIAATANAHYTHSRMCRVLNTPFLEIPVDSDGNPDLDYIHQNGDRIGTLVVTMGTTGLGIVEPFEDLLELALNKKIRIHLDAAYGGFFKLIETSLPKRNHWKLMHEADSIVIDPHKHGLQPYGCGSILFKDPSVGKFYKHDSPYTYFTSPELHLGEISLECSRAGASAAAFWATLQLLPLTKDGLGSTLSKTREAALRFHSLLGKSSRFTPIHTPDLDIAGYFKIPQQKRTSAVSSLSRQVFEKGLNESPEKQFHVSLFTVPADAFTRKFPDYTADTGEVTVLRSVFMKEEHLAFTDEYARRLGL
jgi:glutamate/tyrosine decarboxylase-like PLP-dependent enzyme